MLATPGRVVDTNILQVEAPVGEERVIETSWVGDKDIKKELASQVVAIA